MPYVVVLRCVVVLGALLLPDEAPLLLRSVLLVAVVEGEGLLPLRPLLPCADSAALNISTSDITNEIRLITMIQIYS